jgi:pyrroline-5-carboxylate reductase
METTIGVIGTGNMGSALVRGWLRAGDPGLRLLVWDKVEEAARRLVTCEAVTMPTSLEWLVKESDPLVVVVKPKDAASVLPAVAPFLRPGQKLVSSMAGVDLARLRALAGPAPVLFRVMPNLGVELGAGAVAVSDEPGGPASALQAIIDLFSRLGLALPVPEEMLDGVTAVAGTGPALLAVAVEALEDGAVAAGLSRALARRLVRQTARHTACLLADFADSPARLRAALAGRGPRWESGVAHFQERGVAASYRGAVIAAARRGQELRVQAATGQGMPCTLEEAATSREAVQRTEEGRDASP